jgi:hypothetical protein
LSSSTQEGANVSCHYRQVIYLLLLLLLLLLTANWFVPGGSGTAIHKKQKITHPLKTIRNRQNYEHNAHKITNTMHTKLQTQQYRKHKMELFQPNKEPKVEESALITIRHRPYYAVINLKKHNNTENTKWDYFNLTKNLK